MEEEPKKIDGKIIAVFFAIFVSCATIGNLLPSFTTPFKHGYFVGDMSISYPFVSTPVSDTLVLLLVTLVGDIFFSIAEYIQSKPYNKLKKHIIWKITMKERAFRSTYINMCYLFTAFALLLVVNVGKVMIGRLSPNFLEVCRPIPISYSANISGYVSEYRCSNPDERLVREATSSFPNKNSAMIVYGVTFITLYLSKRLKLNFRLVIQLIQLSLVMIAWCCCLLFIRQNWAHVSDVIAGALLGMLFAVFYFTTFLELFDYKTLENKAIREDTITVVTPSTIL